ncbi:type II toxin-antitoxin system RelE/ParE family toxin [Anatilimnocola sp. NA78]|uniref:type II toxin-antitoxin system RelE/ParE family toxin n=1 Tax=Anatilimnocola sp. NA78 TaxID=3415683 RepID=UPI003CE577D9
MANTTVIRPRARLDVVELASFIGEQSLQASDHFLDACHTTFGFLEESPGIGSFYVTSESRLTGLRVLRIKGFPNHLVFYFARPFGIEIVRVLHGARDLDLALQNS